MKRLALRVLLCTAALLISSSLYAQRGMSGRGGGGSFHSGGGFRSAPSGGFRSAPSGFRSSPAGFRSGPGVRTFSPAPRTGFSAFAPSNHVFVSRPFFPGHTHFVSFNRGFGFHHFHDHFGF